MGFIKYFIRIGFIQAMINGKDAIDTISINSLEKYICYITLAAFIFAGGFIAVCAVGIPIPYLRILFFTVSIFSILTPILCIAHVGYTYWSV